MIIDTRFVRVAAGVAKKTTGLDTNKKTPGRKRGLAVDLMGLIIGVVILAASAGAASAQPPQAAVTSPRSWHARPQARSPARTPALH
ncbi:hypothetical protein ACWDR5_20460 [Streptomyces koyangensis]